MAVEAAEEWWRAQGGRRPANVLLPMEPPPLAPPQGEPPAQQQQPQRQQEGRPDSALNGAPMDSSSDARTLAIRTRADGERLVLSWRNVAERVEEVAAPDWPLNGPRTVTWICRFIDRRGGGGPNAYHQWWQQSKFLKSDTPAVKLHGLLCEALEFAATYDCLDVTNLVCFERLLREVQQIEHDYRDAEDGHHSGNRGPSNGGKAGSGSLFDQGAVFSGLSRDKGQIMCCPSLLEYIASDLAISTNVQKQLRKADEERAFARKNKKAPPKDKDEK